MLRDGKPNFEAHLTLTDSIAFFAEHSVSIASTQIQQQFRHLLGRHDVVWFSGITVMRNDGIAGAKGGQDRAPHEKCKIGLKSTVCADCS